MYDPGLRQRELADLRVFETCVRKHERNVVYEGTVVVYLHERL